MEKLNYYLEQLFGIISRVPPDKLGHFVGGVLIYTVTHFINSFIGLTIVILFALAKEGYDAMHRDRHTPEWKDAIATILGGITGAICNF